MTEPKRRDYVEHDDYGRGIVLEVFGREPNRFAEVDWDERREPRQAVLVNTLHSVDEQGTPASPLEAYTGEERALAICRYAADYAEGIVTRGWEATHSAMRVAYLDAARVILGQRPRRVETSGQVGD